MSNARKFLIVLGVIAFGVVGSLPYLRHSTPHARQPQDAHDAALIWHEGPSDVLLDISSQADALATGDDSRTFNPANANNISQPPIRRVLKGPVRLEKDRTVPELPSDYRPLADPGGLPSQPNGQTRSDAQQEISSTSLADEDERESHPAGSAVRRYTIVDGDTLPQIAERFLGDRHRDAEIFQANQAVLSNPNSLPIGVEIVIPAAR